jgi:hypothetical protein
MCCVVAKKNKSHNNLISRAIQSVIVDFFRREIGNAMTFKYQCPSIIEKNTPAVIADPIKIEKDER